MHDADLLARHGWDDERARHVSPGETVARIVRVDRGECDVMTAAGRERVVSDSARAQSEVAPAVGDWVVLGDPTAGDKRIVARVLPRGNTLVRRDPSTAVVDQVLVANVDEVAIVHGLDRPLPPGRLERFLVQVWDSSAQPLVVLSKADLAHDLDDVEETVRAVAPDVDVLATGLDGRGIDDLRARITPGRTLALVGASGVGKSTLVNLLVGEEVQETREVRARDAKGRHTTTARELLLVPEGGAVIDTPGVRAVGLWADEEALHRVFADIEERAELCRFSNCAHDREPGCAVRDVVDPRRLERYRSLLAEIDELRERSRARRKR
ncbi:MAG TPA: ribosome small subunit-dependent GTPase A [Acidimicrobiales bacterium]